MSGNECCGGAGGSGGDVQADGLLGGGKGGGGLGGLLPNLGGGLGSLFGDAGWLKFLLQHRKDFTRLLAIFNSFDGIDLTTDDGFSKALDLSLEAAALLTKFSATDKDDAFVKSINDLLADADLRKSLAELLRGIVAKGGTVKASEDGAEWTAEDWNEAASVDAAFAVASLGFDWHSLLQLLPIVVGIVKHFWPKKPGQPGPAPSPAPSPAPADVTAEASLDPEKIRQRQLRQLHGELDNLNVVKGRLEQRIAAIEKAIAQLEAAAPAK